MSAHDVTRTFSSGIGRRRLLRQAGKAALTIAAAVALIPERLANAAGCCTQCSDYETYRTDACCHLGYNTNCADMSCFDSNHTWWVWGCCDASNFSWSCYECCDWRCSKATSSGSHCPQRPARSTAKAA